MALAKLTIDLNADVSGFEGAMGAAAGATEVLSRSQERYLATLKRQAETIGKTRAELAELKAQTLGVSAAAQPYIDRLREAERGLTTMAAGAKLSAFQTQQLGFQVHDFVVQVTSGQSPLTAFVQQGSQLSGTFGGAGAALRAVATLVTPLRVAFGAAVAGIGAVAYATYEGAAQSKAFADAVVLSGNAAGLTEGKFTAMARQIAAGGQVQVSAAREYGLALAATGEIGQKNFALASEAAARFGAATGKTAKDVAEQFAALNRDVSAGAADLNRGLNILSAAQLQQIRTLQDQGKSTEAVAIVYGSLNDRLKALEPNLGTLDRAIRTVSGTWKDFWDRAFDIGRAETIDQKIDAARKRIEALQKTAEGRPNLAAFSSAPALREDDSAEKARTAALRERAAEELRLLSRSKGAQEDAANAAAELIKLNRAAANADDFVRGEEKRAKAADGLARALAEANKAFAAQDALAARDADYKPSSAETRAAILKKIREDFTDKGAASKAAASAKAYAELSRAITEKISAAEQELEGGVKLSDAQKFALDIVTKLGDAESKLTEVQRIAVGAELERYLTAAKSVQVRADLTKAEQAYARELERSGDAMLRQRAGIDDQNAALADQIAEFGLAADAVEKLRIRRLEEALAARQTAIAIERASGTPTDPNADREDAVTASLQRQIELRKQLAELNLRDAGLKDLRDAAADASKSIAGGVAEAILKFGSLRDVVRGVVQDLARITVRTVIEAPLQRQLEGVIGKGLGLDTSAATAATTAQTAAVTTNTGAMAALTAAATTAAGALNAISASSVAGGASGFSTFFAGNDFLENPFAAVALADGTNYVPRDGLKATLHKGEAVVPAKFNPYAGGSRAGGPTVIVNAPPGTAVDRQESRQGPNGSEIEVWLRAAKDAVASDIAGGGRLHDTFRNTYGLGRTLPRRA